MSRRFIRRRRHPAAVALAAVAVLLAVESAAWLLQTAWHVIPLLFAAAAGAGGYRIGRHRASGPARPPRVIQGHAEDAEAIRLRAEVDQLRAERDEARESAARAWDASTEPAPRSARDRLLSDRLSGVHELFRRDQ